jgi:hypothetical protein
MLQQSFRSGSRSRGDSEVELEGGLAGASDRYGQLSD